MNTHYSHTNKPYPVTLITKFKEDGFKSIHLIEITQTNQKYIHINKVCNHICQLNKVLCHSWSILKKRVMIWKSERD